MEPSLLRIQSWPGAGAVCLETQGARGNEICWRSFKQAAEVTRAGCWSFCRSRGQLHCSVQGSGLGLIRVPSASPGRIASRSRATGAAKCRGRKGKSRTLIWRSVICAQPSLLPISTGGIAGGSAWICSARSGRRSSKTHHGLMASSAGLIPVQHGMGAETWQGFFGSA